MESTQIQSQHSPDKSPTRSSLILDEKFKITGKIGRGSFGIIYKAQELITHDQVAIKIEKKLQSPKQQSMLTREVELLQSIGPILGFPKLYSWGRCSQQNYIALQYLGLNLGQLLKKCEGKFSLMTVAMIGFQIVERLEVMHNATYLHRDIKPENFLIGLGQQYGIVFIIDFGLSKQYFDPQTKKHIPKRDKKGLVGTARYVSISTHQGFEQGRKDDLESLAYLLIYFAKGNLPWQNLQIETKQDKFNKIKELKQLISTDELCQGLPNEFKVFLEETRGYQFEQEPNYFKLKKVLLNVIMKQKQITIQQQFYFD